MKGSRGGSLYRMKGSPFWWLKYYDQNGKPVYESSKKESQDQANRLLVKRLTEVQGGQLITPKTRKVRVAELVEDVIKYWREVEENAVYADAQQARWDNHLKPFFEGMRAAALGTDQILEYRSRRMAEVPKPSPTTVNRELQVLRRAFRRAFLTTKKIASVPAFEMASEKNNARKVFITEEDKRKLREAAANDTSEKAKMKGPALRAFVELLFGLGWRKGELLGLKVGNIDLAENIIRIETSKNDDPREVKLTPNLAILLREILRGRMNQPQEPLFPAQDMRWAWKRLCKRAGVKAGKMGGYIMHDTRRTSARTKRSAGVPTSVIMELQGWKSEEMFRRYGIVNNEDKLVGLERAEAWERQQAENSKRLEFGENLGGSGTVPTGGVN